MTEKEAIKILNPDADVVWKAYDGKDLERCNEACRVACVALAKQIPQKPSETDKARCIHCACVVKRDERFCKNCGQALDWSD